MRSRSLDRYIRRRHGSYFPVALARAASISDIFNGALEAPPHEITRAAAGFATRHLSLDVERV